jgi:hypothetical protein
MDMETTTATLGFEMDAFASRHLRDWFWAGMAPFDWDYNDLEAFEAWVTANADEIYNDSSWTSMARWFEASR